MLPKGTLGILVELATCFPEQPAHSLKFCAKTVSRFPLEGRLIANSQFGSARDVNIGHSLHADTTSDLTTGHRVSMAIPESKAVRGTLAFMD